MTAPVFIRVIPAEVERYGPAGAIVLAHIRYRCTTSSASTVDGVRWWRVSRQDLGRAVGLSIKAVRTALRALDGAIAANHFEPLSDQSLAYRVIDDEPPINGSELSEARTGTWDAPTGTWACPEAPTGISRSPYGHGTEPVGASALLTRELEEEEREEAPPQRASEPPNLPAVPDTAIAPSAQISSRNENIIEGQFVDPEPVDAEPPEHCDAHMPFGTHLSCGPCKIARLNHDAWTKRQASRVVVELRHRRERAEAAKPRWRCNVCHDGGVVLNSDGKPGSQIRICHHDNTWHIAAPEELAEKGIG